MSPYNRPHRRRRTVLAITAIAAASALFAGCGASPEGATESEVTYWVVPNTSQERMESFLSETATAFHDANSELTMKGTVIPWEDAATKLTAAFAGGNPPDAAYLVAGWMNTLDRDGLLADLNQLDNIDEILEGVPQSYIDAGTNADGELVGAPYLGGLATLTINQDVWERAGKPALPTTWEETIPFAQKLTFDANGNQLGDADFDADNVEVYGMSWPAVFGIQVNYMWNYLKAYGASVLNEDQSDIGFNNAEGRAALTYLKQLVDSGAATPPGLFAEDSQWWGAVKEGSVGMAWSVNLEEAELEKYPDTNIAVIDVPAGPAGQFLMAGIGFISVAKDAKNPEAALKLGGFLASPEQRDIYTRMTLTKPVRPPAEGEKYYTDLPDPRLNDFQNEASAQVKHAWLMPNLKFDPQEYLIGKINDYLLGNQDLDAMLEEASQQVQQLAAQAG